MRPLCVLSLGRIWVSRGWWAACRNAEPSRPRAHEADVWKDWRHSLPPDGLCPTAFETGTAKVYFPFLWGPCCLALVFLGSSCLSLVMLCSLAHFTVHGLASIECSISVPSSMHHGVPPMPLPRQISPAKRINRKLCPALTYESIGMVLDKDGMPWCMGYIAARPFLYFALSNPLSIACLQSLSHRLLCLRTGPFISTIIS